MKTEAVRQEIYLKRSHAKRLSSFGNGYSHHGGGGGLLPSWPATTTTTGAVGWFCLLFFGGLICLHTVMVTVTVTVE
jgi:hypothetical protein